ncbi:MAG: arylsulfatase [Verrucomicrobia bacterium]|nr:arylsulfatase [Verrucomicrobiota bacterium]
MKFNLMLCLAAALCVSAVAPAADSPRRPNVLLILTDDQGYGDLSIHGNPHLSTPHIDRLGREGVRFDRFYVNSFCAPTRAALLTGRYPIRTGTYGVTHNKETMRAGEVTIAEALRSAGYRTACIGKWHNGEQFPFTPPGQGFELFFGFHNGHWNNYFNAELLRGATFEETKGYITDVLADEAIRFIEKNRTQPFFCYAAFNAPHSPYQVPDKYFNKFRAKGFDETVACFYGMCENLDDNVGRLLATLDRCKLADETIVLFMTDNGGTAGVKVFNAGMRGGKVSVHEGGSRVPLFMRWRARGWTPRVVPQLASHIDIYPTLLDLCGVKPPPGPKLDGVSLRPLLEGAPANWPERALFIHNPIDEHNKFPGAVRTQKYRLVMEVKGPGGGSRAKANDAAAKGWQLYDMEADSGEERNLAAQMPDVVAKLSKAYDDWFADISRDGLRRMPIPVGYDEENPVELHAPQAFFDGNIRFYAGPGFANDWLTGWTATTDKVWFDLDVARAGAYEVCLRQLCLKENAGAKVRVGVGNAKLEGVIPGGPVKVIPLPNRVPQNKSKNVYENREWSLLKLGQMNLTKGPARLMIEAVSNPGGVVMDLKGVVLRRQD